MQIRDRVIELRRVRAGDLRPHPRNWRSHPPLQRDALRGVLAEIGFAAALLVRQLEDGSLQLIDGHLRAETLPDALVPVLVLDVNEAEAVKLLALVDSLSALAEPQPLVLNDLLQSVESDNEAVKQVLSQLAERAADGSADAEAKRVEPTLSDSYQILVDCRDEQEQQSVYQQLTSQGLRCRVLTL